MWSRCSAVLTTSSVQAMAGLHGGSRLAPHLLFSDRDFNENDYEALLALDEGIENRRGVSRA